MGFFHLPAYNQPLPRVRVRRDADGRPLLDEKGCVILATDDTAPTRPRARPRVRIPRQRRISRYRRRHSHVEPADAVVTRLFTELQQRRSPQHERYVFVRLVKRLLALPVPADRGDAEQ